MNWLQDRLAAARPLLWAAHGEVVIYQSSPGSERPLLVIWSSGPAEAVGSGEPGASAAATSAAATAHVRVADLPQVDGRALLVRLGQAWAITRWERPGPATWRLHLALPRPERRLPERWRA